MVYAETASIRTGEELDTRGLSSYLRSKLESANGEIDETQFPAGSSNLTYPGASGRPEMFSAAPSSEHCKTPRYAKGV